MFRIIRVASPLVFFTGAAFAGGCPDNGQCQFPKVTPSGAQAGDLFGRAVDTDGEFLLIGAPSRESVTVYRKSPGQWTFDGELSLGGAANDDEFGWAVAVDGPWAFVGARADGTLGTNAGAVLVFQRTSSGWSFQQKLTSSNGQASDRFGGAVAVRDGYAVVGHASPGKASAYVFRYSGSGSGWVETQELAAPSFAGGFSFAVDIDAERIIVGAWGDDTHVSDGGAAFVYERNVLNTYVLERKLTAADFSGLEPNALDYFGAAVSIEGSYVAIGAYGRDDAGSNAGAVYMYYHQLQQFPDPPVWTVKSKVVACDAEAADNFGRSVSLDPTGPRAIVGAPYEDEQGSSAGAAYVLRLTSVFSNTWEVEEKLTACDGEASDFFGWAVATAGDYPIVGAYGDDANGSLSGSAYVFSLAGSTSSDCFCRCPGPAFDLSYGAGKPGTNGIPVLTGSKPPLVGDTTGLRMTNALPGALVWLAIGFTATSVPFDGGTLLVGNPYLLTLPTLVPASGVFTIEGMIPNDPLLCAATVYHQLWFQDPGAAGFYHTAQTNGLARTFGS